MVDLETLKKAMKSKKRDETPKDESEPMEPPTKKIKKKDTTPKEPEDASSQLNQPTNEEIGESGNEILEPENNQSTKTIEKKKKLKTKNLEEHSVDVPNESVNDTKKNEQENTEESENKTEKKIKKNKKSKKKSLKKPKEPVVIIRPTDLSIEELEARILEIKNRPTITNTAKRKLGSLKKILAGKKEQAEQANESTESTPANDESNPTENNETKVKGPKDKSKLNKKNTRFCVFVGNITYTTTKAELQEHFSKVGELVDVRIPPPKKGETKPRGFAYVELKDKHAYEKALELHHSFLAGRRINVFYTTGNKNKNPEQQKKDIQKKNFKLSAMRDKGLFREENKIVCI